MNCPICKRPLAGNGRCYTCNVDNMVLFAEHLERKQQAEAAEKIMAAQERIMQQEATTWRRK